MIANLKSFSLTLFLIFMAWTSVWAQNSQLLFDKGALALQNGRLDEAKELFWQIEDQDSYSGALFVNLGLIAVQEDSLGLAKYYFTAASRFEETMTEAIEGVRYVENRLRYRTPVLPKLPWDKAVDFLSDSVGPTAIAVIGVLLLNAAAIILVLMWLGRIPAFLTTFGFVSTTIVSLLIIGLAFYVESVEGRYSEAIQVTDQAMLREAPAEDGTLVSNTFEGYAFTIDWKKTSGNDWYYVRLSNGTYGWIHPKHLKIIPI